MDTNSVYQEYISKNIFNKQNPISLGDILNKCKEITQSKLGEIESKKEENEKMEKDLAEYKKLVEIHNKKTDD